MRDKCVKTAFDYIIEDDFNADMVQCGLLDCYDTGFYRGLAIGGFMTLITAIPLIFVCKRTIKKEVKS